MEKQEEYKKHIEEGWNFSKRSAEAIAEDERIKSELALKIFERVCSPYHYFLKEYESGTSEFVSPSDKQIKYAKDLNIENPEKYSKDELSKKIDEVLKVRKGEK